MTQVHEIRKLYFEQGQSITQVSRQTGRDRKTIRMYLEKEDWNLCSIGASPGAEFPKLEPFKADINEWLGEDKLAKRKQRHTAMRIYHRLGEKYPQSFNCSYRTVAGYVAKRKKEVFSHSGGYLPLEHKPGEAQADFGEAEFYENGHLYSGKYLNLSFPNSNQGYLQLFKGENQECLFEGLKSIFEHIGGVPRVIWFDNTRTIVGKILKDNGRVLADDFLRFQEHYRFEAVFCNVDAGHEKGNVESKVGYHRRNLLVPVPRFDSMAEFNCELLERCDLDAGRQHYRRQATIAELYAYDKAALLALPSVSLDTSKYFTAKTNGYGRFYLHNGLHEYSVSPQYASSRVTVKMTAGEIIPLDRNYQPIVKHTRLYGNSKQQSMQWLPYLTQLSRKPNALKYSGIYSMLPPSIKEYLGSCNQSHKGQTLRVLAALTEKDGFTCAVRSVDQALEYGVTDIDSLLSLHHRLYDKFPQMTPLHLDGSFPQAFRVNPDLAAYDAGLEKAGTP